MLIVLLLPDGIVGAIRKVPRARATRGAAVTVEVSDRVSLAVKEASPRP